MSDVLLRTQSFFLLKVYNKMWRFVSFDCVVLLKVDRNYIMIIYHSNYSCEYRTMLCVKRDESSWNRLYVWYEPFWYPIHHTGKHHESLKNNVIIEELMSSRGIWVAHSAALKHATRAFKQRIICVGLEDGLMKDWWKRKYFLRILRPPTAALCNLVNI